MPEVGQKRAPQVIGIVGSRRRDTHRDYDLLEAEFFKVFEWGDTIVSGGCPKGGDKFAEMIARRYGITIVIHHARWDGPDGRAAGWVRNSLIARDCDVLLAVVAADRRGGTEDTVKKVKRLGKPVVIVGG